MSTRYYVAADRFLAVLFNGPLLQGDAIVLLCGDDATPRLAVAHQLLAQGAAPTILLSGGLDGGGKQSANTLAPVLMGMGVAFDRIKIDADAKNTHEQAVNVIEYAKAHGWGRILLVASAYHMPRAFLTFVKAIGDDAIQVVPVPASHTLWGQAPDGKKETRLDLYADELRKIDEYEQVATYQQGLDYLLAWEGK